MITGRRKFLVVIVVFISVYATLFIYYGRGIKLAIGAGLIGLIGIFAVNFFIPRELTRNRPLATSTALTSIKIMFRV